MISKISDLTTQTESVLLLASLLLGTGLSFDLSFRWVIYFLNNHNYIYAAVLITIATLITVGSLIRIPIALITTGITAATLGSAVATNTYGLLLP